MDQDSLYTPALDTLESTLKHEHPKLALLKLKHPYFSLFWACGVVALGKLLCNFIAHIATEVSFGTRHNVLNARTRNIIIHYCVFQGSSRCIFKYSSKKLESPENKWERLFLHNGN